MENKITKEIMQQYENVRQSGATNMFDYWNVMSVANKFQFHQLGSLTQDEYLFILQGFSRLMSKFNISQESI